MNVTSGHKPIDGSSQSTLQKLELTLAWLLSVSILMTRDRGIPPGIDDTRNLECYASGGDENTWLYFSKKRYYTNAFIVEDGKVSIVFYSRFLLEFEGSTFVCFQKLLLGLKKRGHGMNK